MPSTDSDRIAVLIDADNTSPRHAGPMLQEVATFGVATVKRAYGDWTGTQLTGWKAVLNEHAVQPMQQFAYTTGKNSTDSALIIDAMDLLYSGHVDAFAIVSSDSDFTRLATRLRESGKTVIGLGLRKTPQSLVKACDRFVYLELLSQGSQDAADESADEAAVALPDLQQLLVEAVTSASHEDGWASLSAVGSQVNRSNPSFDVRAYGERKLVDLVRKQTFLEVTDEGPVRLRLRASRPARKATGTRSTAKKTTAKRSASKKAAAVEPAVEAAVEPVVEAPVAPVAPVAPAVLEPAPPKVTTRRRSQAAQAPQAPQASAQPSG